MALVARHPEYADKIVGFGVPIFPSEEAARKHLGSLGFLARLMANGSPLAPRMCRLMCDYRSFARFLAPLLAPRLPYLVAADGVDHIWESYAGTLNVVLSRNQAKEWATALAARLHLVYGAADRTSPPNAAIRTLGNRSGARIKVVEGGDHHLPLRQAKFCARYLRAILDRRR